MNIQKVSGLFQFNWGLICLKLVVSIWYLTVTVLNKSENGFPCTIKVNQQGKVVRTGFCNWYSLCLKEGWHHPALMQLKLCKSAAKLLCLWNRWNPDDKCSMWCSFGSNLIIYCQPYRCLKGKCLESACTFFVLSLRKCRISWWIKDL